MQLDENPLLFGMVVRDVDKILDFYLNSLGMEVGWTEPMDEGGMKHYLRFDGGVLKIFAPDKTPEKTRKDILGYAGYRMITFMVTNIDELAKSLKERNARIIVPIQDAGSVKWMLVLDPEGNCIEFAQRA